MGRELFRVDTWRPKLTHYFGAIALGINLLLTMPVDRMLAGVNDFAHFYIGGHLFGSPDIHSMKANTDLQKQILGAVLEHSYFVRPTFYGAFYKPLAALSYPTAYLIYQIICVIACSFFIAWNLRRLPGFAALAVMFPPMLANFINGQDVILLVTLTTLALRLAEKGHDFAAGFVVSLCAFKPHYFLLTPFAVFFHRRWRVAFGAASGLASLFVLGLFSGGWETQRKFLELVRNPDNSPFSGIMPSWRSVDPSAGPVYILLCATTVAIMGFLASRASSFSAAFVWCMVGGLLISFHSYMQDCLILLLAIAVVAKDLPRHVQITFLLAVLPVPYFLLQWGPPFSPIFVSLVALTPVLAAWTSFSARPIGLAGKLLRLRS